VCAGIEFHRKRTQSCGGFFVNGNEYVVPTKGGDHIVTGITIQHPYLCNNALASAM
jgi:hypothetical protein